MAITRAEILRRSVEGWPQGGVPYSMNRFWSDGYRQDCSGYVSMCWAAPKSGAGTWGGYSTVSFVTEGVMVEIGQSELQPGDAIGLCGPGTDGANGHIMLWIGRDGTRHRIREQAGGVNGWQERVVSWPKGYKAYRSVLVADEEERMVPDSPVLNVVLDGTTARYTWNTPDGHGKAVDSVIFRLGTVPFPLPPKASNGNVSTGEWPQPWGTAYNHGGVAPGQTLYAQVLARNEDGWSQPGSAVLVVPNESGGSDGPSLDEIRQVVQEELAKQPKPLTAEETEQATFKAAQRAETQ